MEERTFYPGFGTGKVLRINFELYKVNLRETLVQVLRNLKHLTLNLKNSAFLYFSLYDFVESNYKSRIPLATSKIFKITFKVFY